MSVNSSLQQIAGEVASVIAGLIVSQGPDGNLEHFTVLGYILVCTAGSTLFMMYRINQMVTQNPR